MAVVCVYIYVLGACLVMLTTLSVNISFSIWMNVLTRLKGAAVPSCDLGFPCFKLRCCFSDGEEEKQSRVPHKFLSKRLQFCENYIVTDIYFFISLYLYPRDSKLEHN